MALLFVHGAGAEDEDRPLAEALAKSLRLELRYPRISDADMSLEAWAKPVRAALDALAPDDVVVAHSFGATVLVRVLGEPARSRALPRAATLLAMPDWGPTGWDVAAYVISGAEPPQTLSLHHCRDDEVVPFAHLALSAARLPSASVHAHPRGGHQLVLGDTIEAVAADVRGALSRRAGETK